MHIVAQVGAVDQIFTKIGACWVDTKLCNAQDSDMPQNQFIGSAEAALLLHIDRSTLIRWVAAGKLTPSLRVSDTPTGAHLFERAAVERLASLPTRRAS